MPTFTGTIEDFVAGDDLEVTRTITNVPTGATLTDAWLTVKREASDLDAAAIFQKAITAADVPGTGQITDTGDDETGAVRFDLQDVDTILLSPGVAYLYDIQVKTDGNAIYTPETGRITARPGVTTDIS